MSKSRVTYCAFDGTVILGEATRSNRTGVVVPSFALTWNNAFDAVPQNVLLVVHGTVGVPPTWIVAHPAGRNPGLTPLKFSEKIVVGTGVPVFCVNSKVVEPCAVETFSENSILVPGTNPGETLYT